MITSPFIAGLAKVVAVGALMAAGAGGIYVVASTQSDEGEPRVVAETPTPSGADTSTPEPGTPATNYDPDLLAPGEMVVHGWVWLDARPVSGDIEAWIDGVLCGTAVSGEAVDDYVTGVSSLRIPAASKAPGCGTPGAVIRFRVAGRDANQSAVWQDGRQLRLDLVAGPSFAQYHGQFRATEPFDQVEPLIGGIPCGYQLNPLMGIGPEYGYHVVVYPESLRPGCGRPGAVVTFRHIARDDQGQGAARVIANLAGSEPWRTDGVVERAGVAVP